LCIQDSVKSYQSPLDIPRLTTLGTGTAKNLSTNLSGGTDQLREFLSLRLSDLVGVTKLSAAETDRITRMCGTTPPSWMRHPHAEQDVNGSSRKQIRVGNALDVSLTANGLYRNVVSSNSGTTYDGVGINESRPAALASWPYDTLIFLPGEQQRAK